MLLTARLARPSPFVGGPRRGCLGRTSAHWTPSANGPGRPRCPPVCSASPVQPGYAADRDGETRQAFLLGAPSHSLHHLATDRAHFLEQLVGHTQLLGLLAIGISDETGLEPGRASRYPGDRLGNPATGAGLGGGDVGIEQLQAPAQFSGQLGNVVQDTLLIRRDWRLPYTSIRSLQGSADYWRSALT